MSFWVNIALMNECIYEYMIDMNEYEYNIDIKHDKK